MVVVAEVLVGVVVFEVFLRGECEVGLQLQPAVAMAMAAEDAEVVVVAVVGLAIMVVMRIVVVWGPREQEEEANADCYVENHRELPHYPGGLRGIRRIRRNVGEREFEREKKRRLTRWTDPRVWKSGLQGLEVGLGRH